MKQLFARMLALIFACSLSALAADVAGKWNLTAKDPDDVSIKAELSIEQKGGQWYGSIKGPEGSVTLRNIKVDGSTVSFDLDYAGAAVKIKMKLEGNTLKGTYTADEGSTGPVEATRASQTTSAAGVWNLKTVGPDGTSMDVRLTLTQNGSSWSGEIVTGSYDVQVSLQDVKVDGGSVSFHVPTEIGVYSVTAQVEAGAFKGTATDPEGSKNPINGMR